MGQSAYLGPSHGFLPEVEDAAHRDPPSVGVLDSFALPCGTFWCVCKKCAPLHADAVAVWRETMRESGASDERIALWLGEVSA
jgi:hypothetical protein